MAVGYSNLDSYVKSLINSGYPDIGQVFYMVDSDFRTAAQGWSRADRTGPLDLYEARKAGPGGVQYVYRTGDYLTDRAAMQALVDAATDFRGDTMFLTPGSYNPLTSVTVDVDGLRILGPPIRNIRRTRTTITSAGGLTNTLDISSGVDNIELGFFRIIPVTQGNSIRINASDDLYAHNLFWDTTGVTAHVNTIGFSFVTAASLNPEIRDCAFWVDGAQGEALALTQTTQAEISGCSFISDAGTWARAISTNSVCLYAHVDLCYFGGRGLITSWTVAIATAAGANQIVFTRCYADPDNFTNIETGYDATVAIQLAECYGTGDAAGQGGALLTLA